MNIREHIDLLGMSCVRSNFLFENDDEFRMYELNNAIQYVETIYIISELLLEELVIERDGIKKKFY